IERTGIDATDVILAAPPMSHAYAYGMCVMVPLVSGASVVSLRAFKAASVHHALREFDVSLFPAVPAMLDVLTFGLAGNVSAPRRAVLSAGSPLPQRTAARFQKAFGVDVRPLYGTTETGGISVGFADAGMRCDGAVGPAMAGVDIEVRPHPGAAGSGADAGMLYVRSSSMMAGYVDESGIDDTPLDDEWFKTGDLARLDDDGEIRLLGRDSEVINVSGMKVVPLEVEQVIAASAGVVAVKVYPGRRRSGEQFVQAAMVLESGTTVDAVRRHCAEHLVYYKRPERMHPVESLPRSPSGKILIQQLPAS
ncbi:MAG: long-chain fatty acid--CoA ligase, partial [Planctomycetaceae bacterium]|nr:long-chain fatty acid--CoA ligase [Planctomycetaceae bacterium]